VKLPFPLQEDEKVLAVARRHWLYLYPRLILELFLALAPVGALLGLLANLDRLEGLTRTVALAASGLWLLYWLVRLYFLKYRYDNDIWVVTNQRVRVEDSLKRHWFHLEVSAADLTDIQDTTVSRSGFLRTIFDFGDIDCQTAGTLTHFALKAIPKPQEVQALLDKARDELRAAIG